MSKSQHWNDIWSLGPNLKVKSQSDNPCKYGSRCCAMPKLLLPTRLLPPRGPQSPYYVRIAGPPVIKPNILKIKLSTSLLLQLHQTSLPLSRKAINQLEHCALKAATAKSKARPKMKALDLDAMGSEMVDVTAESWTWPTDWQVGRLLQLMQIFRFTFAVT